ncbi:hypothetical protein SASPL_111982 [Salvia splendens]|uniref:Bifunctional inhibitor/plant lipid transfer protein/seed storage helical domain-containing protein n=1 Tax=Salvia splendens TaxID=180675 RepID=A0A8X8Y944_SALSN|nr:hypothetical protein SASPL_111982 [Salvia splendens]
MGSKKTTSLVLFLVINLVFFTLSSACGSCPTPKPKPPPPLPKPTPCPPPPATPSKPTCPRDTLKLGVCANLLGGLIGATIGTPLKVPCCTLIEGLADVEAAVCLCTALKANILGINLNVPISLSLLLNVCSKKLTSKLSETGTLRLMPKTLALRAVHRHTAASRSAKPSMSVQHGVLGGVPTTRCTKAFSKLAQTPNFKVSLGHFPFDTLWPWPWWWDGGFGAGVEGEGGHGTLVELTNVKRRMFRTMKMAVLEAIWKEGFI